MPCLADVLALLQVAQALLQLSQAPQLVVLTRGAQRPTCLSPGAASVSSLASGGAWGLTRVLQLEATVLSKTAADQPQGPVAAAAAQALLAGIGGAAQEGQLAWSGPAQHAARLRRGVVVLEANAAAAGLCRGTVYAVTGEAAPASLRCRPLCAMHLRLIPRPAT